MTCMQLVNGNLDSDPNNPLFLLDESLVPVVAKALALVGFRIIDVVAAIGRKGALDPDIISWCRENDAIWIHADDRAKRKHKVLLETNAIRTLWVYRIGGQMSGKEQLRILAFVLPKFIENMRANPKVRHYKANTTNELAKISLRPFQL